MCGILGGKGPQLSNKIRKSIGDLNRRGPDSKNIIEINSEIVFGATRLAMTDPHPRSDQPMVDEKTRSVLVFNGEIYNFRELRDELVNTGVSFKTDSDTEVVLKSLIVFGISIVSRFEGMFAFAFYDNVNNELILARDYLGKKPLYYYKDSSKFIFSSQVNVIRNIVGNCKLNMEAISCYLQIGYLLDPLTMYHEILALNPGEILIFDSDKLTLKVQHKFIPSVILNSRNSDNSIEIKDALLARTKGHSKFALSLSGGVDSSILALECAKNKLPVEAYSLRWNADKLRYDIDSKNAEKIANKLGIKFRAVLMPGDEKFQGLLSSYIKAVGEPNSNPTGISMMALYSEIAKDGHRLVLTGDGADEIFGGYSRYSKVSKFNFLPESSISIFRAIVSNKDAGGGFLAKVAINLLSSKSREFWLFWHMLSSQKKIRTLIPDIPSFDVVPLGMELEEIFGRGRVASLMFRDLRTWLTMESNRKLDGISMWYSMEARAPFQSEKVIASAYDNMAKSNFKTFNKELLLTTYPELFNLPINKQKHGFISPFGHWLRSMPNLIEDSMVRLLKFIPIEKNELNKLIDSPNNGDYDSMKVLWRLIILSEWFDSQ